MVHPMSEPWVDWKPISEWESAPDDIKSANVLVAEDGIVSEAYYNGEDDSWWLANTAEHDFDPAHPIYPQAWARMPAPPEWVKL
jgi:hypothetical protein